MEIIGRYSHHKVHQLVKDSQATPAFYSDSSGDTEVFDGTPVAPGDFRLFDEQHGASVGLDEEVSR